MPSRSVFRCTAECSGEYALDEIIYRCPKCGALLEVVHDLEHLRARSGAAWMKLFDERYLRTEWPYGSGVWGKKEWVAAARARRERRLDARGRHQPALGRTLRARARPVRALGQAVRRLAHRVVQGPGHDGAGVDGEADDRRRQTDPRGRVRLDGRHLGGAGGLRGRGRRARDGDPSARQGLHGSARSAAGQRCQRAGDRRRLRRLHGDRAEARRGRGGLPGQQHELVAHRGAEDRRHRDGAAVRLAGSRLGDHPGRQPRQRQRARRRLSDDEGPGPDAEAAAHLRGAGRGGEPALPGVPRRLRQVPRGRRRSRRWRRRSRSATR